MVFYFKRVLVASRGYKWASRYFIIRGYVCICILESILNSSATAFLCHSCRHEEEKKRRSGVFCTDDLTRKRRGWRYEIPHFFSFLSLRKLFSSLFRSPFVSCLIEIGLQIIYLNFSISWHNFIRNYSSNALLW